MTRRRVDEVIDVLAFPPTAATLAAARERAFGCAERLLRLGRWARFVSVGMFLGWIADVTAALAPPADHTALVFGFGSVLLSLFVVSAHLYANRKFDQAAQFKQSTERDFAVVSVAEAQPVLARAQDDIVVAQYLRMVGRQGRPLAGIELAALMQWSSPCRSA